MGTQKVMDCDTSSLRFSCCSNVIFHYFEFVLANRKLGTGRSYRCQAPTPLGGGEEGDMGDYRDNANYVSEPSATEEVRVVYRNLKGEPSSEGQGSYSHEPHWQLLWHPYRTKLQPENKKCM